MDTACEKHDYSFMENVRACEDDSADSHATKQMNAVHDSTENGECADSIFSENFCTAHKQTVVNGYTANQNGFDNLSDEYITEDEWDESKDDDGLSLNSLSGISSVASKGDDTFSLDTLKARRDQLLNSIQSRLSSQNSNLTNHLSEVVNYSSVSDCIEINSQASIESKSNLSTGYTSTPRRGGQLTPALRVLRKWKPSTFPCDSDISVIEEIGPSDGESVHSQCSKSEDTEDTLEDEWKKLNKTLAWSSMCEASSKKEDEDFKTVMAECQMDDIEDYFGDNTFGMDETDTMEFERTVLQIHSKVEGLLSTNLSSDATLTEDRVKVSVGADDVKNKTDKIDSNFVKTDDMPSSADEGPGSVSTICVSPNTVSNSTELISSKDLKEVIQNFVKDESQSTESIFSEPTENSSKSSRSEKSEIKFGLTNSSSQDTKSYSTESTSSEDLKEIIQNLVEDKSQSSESIFSEPTEISSESNRFEESEIKSGLTNSSEQGLYCAMSPILEINFDKDELELSDDDVDPGTIVCYDEDQLLASDDENNRLNNNEKSSSTYEILMAKEEPKTILKDLVKNINNPTEIDDIPYKKKPVEKDLPVFISENPEENKDNNDPEWESLKNLPSSEMFKAVCSRWRNIEIPNPKRDLTLRHARYFHDDEEVDDDSDYEISASKRFHPNSNNDQNLPPSKKFCGDKKKESVTFLFERLVRRIQEDVQTKIKELQADHKNKLMYLGECQLLQKKILMSSRHSKMDMDNQEEDFIREVNELQNEYQRFKADTLHRADYKINCLKASMEELKGLYEFYPVKDSDANNVLYLVENEVDDVEEVDQTLQYYHQFYN